MGKIIDFVTNPDISELAGLSMPQFFTVVSGVFIIGGLANMGRVLLFRVSGERIIQRLRNNLYGTILKQDMSFFDKNRSGELISRLSVDTAVVGKSITNNLSDGLRFVSFRFPLSKQSRYLKCKALISFVLFQQRCGYCYCWFKYDALR